MILLLKLQGKDLFSIHYVNEESVNYIDDNTLSEAISNCVPFLAYRYTSVSLINLGKNQLNVVRIVIAFILTNRSRTV